MIKIAISLNKCNSGGLKSLVMAYLRNFDRNRAQFDLIVDADSNSIPYEEVEKLGGRIFVIPPYQKIFKHLSALKKIFSKNDYDVLYAVNNTMNIFPLYVAKKKGVKVRVSESLTMASYNEFLRTMMKNVLRCFSHCFCNYYMANGRDCGIYQFGKKAMEQGKVTIFLSPVDAKANTFDPELRAITRKKYGWENKIVYGFIARFEKQKNPLFLIDIMYAISRKQKNAHFVIIGAGSLEEKMKERINEYDMDNRLSWLGRREDIKQFYNAFDAFLLPSLYEGLPVVGVESQSTGLPIFYSENITKEARIAELGHYISLKKPAHEWADVIIEETKKNIPNRRGREDDLIKCGFDSVTESNRLLDYFEKAVREQAGSQKNN